MRTTKRESCVVVDFFELADTVANNFQGIDHSPNNSFETGINNIAMIQYQASATSHLSFDVIKDDQLFGKLTYKSWFKFNAVIELAINASYQVEPKGFWGTTIEVRDGENVVLKFKMNWSGEIVILTNHNNIEAGYIFKHKGIFKNSFFLTDQEGTELLVLKPHLKWKKMNYEYQITSSDTFETLPNKELLLMNSLHCANYYMTMMTTSGL